MKIVSWHYPIDLVHRQPGGFPAAGAAPGTNKGRFAKTSQGSDEDQLAVALVQTLNNHQ